MSEGAGRPAPPRRIADDLPDAALRRWPAAVRPYAQLARWDRPIGWQLLLAPCWWGTALVADAVHSSPDVTHLALFAVGAVAMRGAGSTGNDIVDRDIDRAVERTRGRPLASRRVSTRQAAAFLVAQSLVGLAVLLCFDRYTVALGIAALLPVAVYPFMKRITNWPQFVLGLAFAWGALVGWSATAGSLAWPALALYAGAILWTMGYDTIYALQDIADDVGAGIGSTAIRFGRHVRGGVAALYALALVLIAAAMAGVGVGAWAWAGFACFAAHLGWQVARIRRDDTARALTLFRSNRDAGLVLFAGLAIQAWASMG
ncbi:4-hydroxybenzoate octaprenyltransferase [Lichenibacterium minor]|uniref:4-hydroxybenzoate octaprenyltransferase n=1 Tax=Lichenibacterium minor TaxID=2316528 RepID=UPI0026AB41FC